MPFEIIRGNIVKCKKDALVNAANSNLRRGSGVCGAIFAAVNDPDALQRECNELAPLRTGEAAVTGGYGLCRNIIHAVGPVYREDEKEKSEYLLRKAYRSSLRAAAKAGCESVVFPLLSAGVFGYPKKEAVRVATEEIRAFLNEDDNSDMDVALILNDSSALPLDEDFLRRLDREIDRNVRRSPDMFSLCDTAEEYSFESCSRNEYFRESSPLPRMMHPAGAKTAAPAKKVTAKKSTLPGKKKAPAEQPMERFSLSVASSPFTLDEGFAKTLFRLIDERGLKDSEVYNRANVDRRTFNKIKNQEGYMPSKITALALAVGLKLNRTETEMLLDKAGYSLSRSIMLDVIVGFCIENNEYNVHTINQLLYKYDQALLGAKMD